MNKTWGSHAYPQTNLLGMQSFEHGLAKKWQYVFEKHIRKTEKKYWFGSSPIRLKLPGQINNKSDL